jgi:ABC-type Fe3+ transport system substrate-binding protein
VAQDVPAPSKELIQAAQKEGGLTFYTAFAAAASAPLAGQFTATYDIPVNVQRLTSAIIETKFAAEAQANKVIADVVQITDPPWYTTTAGPKGWLLTPTSDEVPVLKTWPKKWTHDNDAFLQCLDYSTIGYNTQLLQGKDVPTSWKDLLNPKWKGAIILTDPRSNNTDLAWCLVMQQTFGSTFLQKLGEQKLQLTLSGITAASSVAAGDAAIAIPSSKLQIDSVQAAGGPIQVMPMHEPTIGGEGWTTIAANCPHPNAAKLFLNYALSQTGQSVTCKSICASVTDAPGAIPLPTKYESPPIAEALTKRSELLGLLGLS